MTTQVTIITPIAPHHQELFVRCADSVRKQTVWCRHLHMVDTDKRGPGYIRNLLLKQVKTPFVVFLDADDYLEPDFIYECLKASKPDSYVYTNWMQGATEHETPHGAFWDTAWHLVTCLIHTSMMRLVGGFNEQLLMMEDTDLFLQFDEHDYCGIQVHKALVHYTSDGVRSKTGRSNGDMQKVKSMLSRRYRVGCCGAESKPNRTPIGKKVEGDVLVIPLWEGNRNIVGQLTGRRYGRGARPRRIWMSPIDAKARKDLYRILPEPAIVPTPKKAVRQRVKRPRTFADMLCAAGVLELPPEPPSPVAATSINPNYVKLNEIAQRIFNVQGKAKPGLNGNSRAIVLRPKTTNPVRTRSAARADKTGRTTMAIRHR